jgi:hypothetical protein
VPSHTDSVFDLALDVREETPRGRGAVAVVSVRGSGAVERVRGLCARASLPIGVPKLVRLSLEDDDLDEALVCALGAEHVEIHLHGSPVLVRALLRSLAAPHIAPRTDGLAAPNADDSAAAAPEERARLLLARAPCEAGARILLDQAEGAWRAALERMARGENALDELDRLTRASHAARFAVEPARVVLAGPVNAGKSTLFNVLAGERRALTSSEPGTTRDVVRATVSLGRYAIELFDTAGERENASTDPAALVERAGQARARAERSRADLVLWLTDAAASAPSAPTGSIQLWTCADRVPQATHPSVSALRDPARAIATIVDLVQEQLGLPDDPWTPGAAAAFDRPSRNVVAELSAALRSGGEQALIDRARDLTGRTSSGTPRDPTHRADSQNLRREGRAGL